MRTCTKCKRELVETEFYREQRTKSGWSSQCKGCKDASRYCVGDYMREKRIANLKEEEAYLQHRLEVVQLWLRRLPPLLLLALMACAPVIATPPVDRIDVLTELPPVARATLTGAAVPLGRVTLIRHRCEDHNGMAPLLLCTDRPRAGESVTLICWAPDGRSQVLAIAIQADRLPDGTLLPQSIRGAPGCMVEVPHESLNPIAPGRAEVELILPSWAAGTSLFLQTIVHAPGENQAGVLMSHGYEMVIGS